LMANAFGEAGRIVLQLCIIINNFGSLIVYIIIIGVLEEWAGGRTWWNERVFVLFTTTVIILLPLCSLKHIGNFFTQIFFPQILISNLSVLSSHVLVPMVLPCCFLFLMCLIYS
jgi:uncharacterized membrane protein YobD (UPF0266 family)